MDWVVPIFELVAGLLPNKFMRKRDEWPWWRRLLTALFLLPLALAVTMLVIFLVAGFGAFLFGLFS